MRLRSKVILGPFWRRVLIYPMGIRMEFTSLEGYPFQYIKRVVTPLNGAYSRSRLDNQTLLEIGKMVLSGCYHLNPPTTSDGYQWFAQLNFPLSDGEIAILFPWMQNFGNPHSRMERSINAYADSRIPSGTICGWIEKLALEITLRAPALQQA